MTLRKVNRSETAVPMSTERRGWPAPQGHPDEAIPILGHRGQTRWLRVLFPCTLLLYCDKGDSRRGHGRVQRAYVDML